MTGVLSGRFCKITSAERPQLPTHRRRRGRWTTLAVSQPDAAKASSSVSVTSPARMVVQSFKATM